MYVVFTHLNCFIEAILMSTRNIPVLYKRWESHPLIISIACWPGVKINPQWLELPIEQIYIVLKMFELLRFDCIYFIM